MIERKLARFLKPHAGQDGSRPGPAGAPAPEDVAASVAELLHAVVMRVVMEGIATTVQVPRSGMGDGGDSSREETDENRLQAQRPCPLLPLDEVVMKALPIAGLDHDSELTWSMLRRADASVNRAIVEVNSRWKRGFGGSLADAARYPLLAVGARELQPGEHEYG